MSRAVRCRLESDPQQLKTTARGDLQRPTRMTLLLTSPTLPNQTHRPNIVLGPISLCDYDGRRYSTCTRISPRPWRFTVLPAVIQCPRQPITSNVRLVARRPLSSIRMTCHARNGHSGSQDHRPQAFSFPSPCTPPVLPRGSGEAPGT